MNITISRRRWATGIALFLAVLSAPATMRAQQIVGDSISTAAPRPDSLRRSQRGFYTRMAAGFAASILIHEAGHVTASYMMGFHPTFGFSQGRPTIYSGIPTGTDKRKQFFFSAAGMTVQDLLDELILDIPHTRGAAFERGLLAGGLGTTLFYITIGRNASVSDVTVMSRNSTLSKGEVSLIFGSVAALQAVRVVREHRYHRFFVAPSERGGLKTGVSFTAH